MIGDSPWRLPSEMYSQLCFVSRLCKKSQLGRFYWDLNFQVMYLVLPYMCFNQWSDPPKCSIEKCSLSYSYNKFDCSIHTLFRYLYVTKYHHGYIIHILFFKWWNNAQSKIWGGLMAALLRQWVDLCLQNM